MIRVKSIMIINCNNKNINKNYSPSGNWTRAFRVRAEYPSQLDQWGVDTSLSRYSFLFRSSNFLFTEFSSHHDSILNSLPHQTVIALIYELKVQMTQTLYQRTFWKEWRQRNHSSLDFSYTSLHISWTLGEISIRMKLSKKPCFACTETRIAPV